MNVNILSSQEAATLQEMIAASQHIVICCHKSPDGDAIGSSLGWRGFLLSQGKQAQVCMPDMMPDYLQWLPDSQTILRYDKHPVDLQISQPHMSSASELVFRIVWQLGGFGQMDRKWAACVYCGMMTDTGGFTYNSTDPTIYFIISQLLTKGIDKDKIYRNVFNNSSLSAIRFRGYLMSEKLRVVEGLHASYYCVTRQDMKRFHFIKGDLEGLVNEPLRIKGHKFSISLREDTERDNLILVSLRSVDDFPCNKVSEQFFNGGGHLNASGGKLFCSMAEAEVVAQKAIKAFEALLK